jgi:N-acetylmuramoyl-L-alanine amidase
MAPQNDNLPGAMSSLSRLLAALALCLCAVSAPAAERLSPLARLDPAASSVRDAGDGVAITLALSQPVPWRAYTLADPPRLVLDFREVDWRGAGASAILAPGRATGLRTGIFAPGWSRLVLDLAGPYAVARADMATDGQAGTGRAVISVSLAPVAPDRFRALSGAPDPPGRGAGPAAPAPEPRGAGPLTVVLDPGHGGLDPGAERDGVTEAALMLSFARELEEALVRAGFRVALTRAEDVFVPLDTRITRARAAGADVFLSLHADAVAEGEASGATVYTLSETASDEAAAALAERHDRADLLAGVDLAGQDDQIAGVLMDLARIDTTPRSGALADALVEGLRASVGLLHKRPRLSAGFSVLRAPDIPSALIELGFLSSADDRDRLLSAEWRARAARGIVVALAAWAEADAARGALRRR